MELKSRKINKGEQFACSVKAVRRLFGGEPEKVHISFAYYHRDHQFDHKDRWPPTIKGTIVAAGSINLRDNGYVGAMHCESKYYVNFYVIRDERYTAEHQGIFVATQLPALYEWYQEMPDTPSIAQSGVQNILIEWRDGSFHQHRYRFQ